MVKFLKLWPASGLWLEQGMLSLQEPMKSVCTIYERISAGVNCEEDLDSLGSWSLCLTTLTNQAKLRESD